MKKTGFIVAIVLLVIVTGLCVLTVYGTYAWLGSEAVDFQFGVVNDTKAVVNDSMTLALEGESELAVDILYGDITISAYDGEDIQIEMVKTAWGPDEDEASLMAEEMELQVERSGDQILLTYRPPDTIGVLRQDGMDSIDVTIQVPEGLALEVNARVGDVTLTGLDNDLVLESEFGDVRIEAHQGNLRVDSRNGEVRLDGVSAEDGSLYAYSEFGDLRVLNVDAGDIYVEGRSGALDAENWTAAGSIEIVSEFGSISLENFESSEFSVDSRNGSVELANGQVNGTLVIKSEFSDIDLEFVWADGYDLESRNGDVTLVGAVGPVAVETEFGAIEITEAQSVQLSLVARNGNISFVGTLDPDTPHSIESEFGEVRLMIPEDSAFDITMETEFGVIRSDHEVMLTGEIDEENWRGEINGGGPLLTIITRNGNINLLINQNE